MRRLAVGLAGIALLASLVPVRAASPNIQPFGANLVWTEQNDGANRPWLDPTCYDDDHIARGSTSGWLDAGQSVTFRSLRVICSAKIQRGLVSFHKRLDADLTLVDYGGHPILTDRRVFTWKSNVSDAACNTDLGTLHVDLDWTGSEPGEPADYAYWTVHANEAGVYTLELILNEPWWQGRESSPNYCPDDGFYDW